MASGEIGVPEVPAVKQLRRCRGKFSLFVAEVALLVGVAE
jgi:hypothetical protein